MIDLDRLKSTLLTSGINQKNNPLYQVINQLIDALKEQRKLILATGLSGGSSNILNETHIHQVISFGDGDGGGGESGPPGPAGINGAPGISNVAGPAGPMGSILFLQDVLEPDILPIPGPQGPAGVAGSSFWDGEVVKSGDESVTNSAAYVEDATLFLAGGVLQVSSIYLIEYEIIYSGTSATGDYRWEWRFGGIVAHAAQMYGYWSGPTVALAAGNLTTEVGTIVSNDTYWGNLLFGTDASGTKFMNYGRFLLATPASFAGDGQLHFRFAQSVATPATNATTYAGSRVRYKKIL